ncbi:MAG: DUF4864 domain-containing protein [Actinomycetes bacterium]
MRTPALAPALLGALLVAGCTTGGEVAAPSPPAPAADGPCDDATFGAIESVVAAQLDDMSAGDWAAALEHATSGFREQVGPNDLEQIITESFPVVADNAEHLAAHCTVQGDAARLAVQVTDTAGADQALVYLLELEEGGWQIAGAVPADGSGPGTGDPGLQA